MIDWDKIIEERNAWVAHNFPKARTPLDSFLGCIEELGELTHAELKLAQGIRGDAALHEANAKDAVGDLTIYLLGLMNYYNFTPGVYHGFRPPESSDDCLCSVLVNLGRMDRAASVRLSGLINRSIDAIIYYLGRFCEFKEWDYEQIVTTTWAQVLQRDWIKNKETGEAA